MLEISPLHRDEIPLLGGFAPAEWNVDLSALFARHFGQPYFHPFVAVMDGTIAGCANALLQGAVGWLGNIIVLPDCRGHGVGTALTAHVIEFQRARSMQYQVLIATSMGEPIYRKLGFSVASYYVFLARPGEAGDTVLSPNVRPLRRADEHVVFALDQAITGESRQAFLERYLDGAKVHVDHSGAVDGFYLPRLGAGLVIASNDDAGLELLRCRFNQAGSKCVVPEQNTCALDLLLSNGYVETSRAPRMTLGPDVDWQPEHVYCRGSGFCG